MPSCGAPTRSGAPCRNGAGCPHHRAECAICLGCKTGPTRALPCDHRFHEACIDEWKARGKDTCPMCRAPFDQPEYRLTVSIERVGREGDPISVSYVDVDADNILNAIDFVPRMDSTTLEIDLESREQLNMILRDLGLGEIDLSRLGDA